MPIESCVAEDARERPSLQCSVERHHQKDRALIVLQPDVTATLPYHVPAGSLERSDELSAGDDRQTLRHARMGIVRRTTPAPIARPSSRSPST